VEQKINMSIKFSIDYRDIHVVDTFEEAEQFRYEHNDETVEVGTAVGRDIEKRCMSTGKLLSVDLHCFDGIYYQP
jgi:hypothetical protein